VNTNLKMRDDNVRGADYLDVANNPTLTFESRRIESVNGRLRNTGDLTIRGVTRSVALDADPISPEIKGLFGEYRRGTRAVGKISRKEFGLKSNPVLEAGAIAVGDEIEITLEVEFKRKAEGVVDNP
jgi:polyisoprenoid-binding protein YceI